MKNNYDSLPDDTSPSLRRLENSLLQALSLFLVGFYKPPFITGNFLRESIINGKRDFSLAGSTVELSYPKKQLSSARDGSDRDFWRTVKTFKNFRFAKNVISFKSWHNVPVTITLIEQDDPLFKYFLNPDPMIYTPVFMLGGDVSKMIYKDGFKIGVVKDKESLDVASADELMLTVNLPNPFLGYLNELEKLKTPGHSNIEQKELAQTGLGGEV